MYTTKNSFGSSTVKYCPTQDETKLEVEGGLNARRISTWRLKTLMTLSPLACRSQMPVLGMAMTTMNYSGGAAGASWHCHGAARVVADLSTLIGICRDTELRDQFTMSHGALEDSTHS